MRQSDTQWLPRGAAGAVPGPSPLGPGLLIIVPSAAYAAGGHRASAAASVRLRVPRLGLRVAGQWRLGACELAAYVFDTYATL